MSASDAAAGREVPVFCSLIPREIVALAGLEPAEVSHPERADGYDGGECPLSDNLCSWPRHLAGRLVAGDHPVVIVPSSCDAMAKLRDVVEARRPGRVFELRVPHRADPPAIRFLAGQYRALLSALGVGEDDLARVRRRVRNDAAPGPQSIERGVRRVGIAGSVFPGKLFCDVVRGAGAQPFVLRRCGMALPHPPPATIADAGLEGYCEQLARHYLQSAVCPRMMAGRFEDQVAADVAALRIDGLIVPVLKFCDFYHAAVHRLADRLPPGFPVQLIEGDLTTGFGEQVVTRLEAFVEGLNSGSPPVRASRSAGSGFTAGIDIGSTQVKVVLLDALGVIAGTLVRPTTGRIADCSQEALTEVLDRAGIGRAALEHVGATGYGRKSLASDAVSTEITCHARGVGHFVRGPFTVIDVGGQDSKVIVTDEHGRVVRFTMNDKCAAGTGRFIDGIVRALALDFRSFSALSAQAQAAVPITSMCSVFAESEVISLTARGESLAGIARGINASIARRVAGMVRKVDGTAPFLLTGGVSQIDGFVKELERELGGRVQVFEHALHAGAIGAALLATERAS